MKKRFEYKMYEIPYTQHIFKGKKIKEEEMIKAINKLGMDGWELVTINQSLANGFNRQSMLIFKRAL